MLHIKLVKSYFGNNPRNRATITALGLKNVGQVVVHNDTPTIRGMIHAIKHVLEVTDGPDVAKKPSLPRNNKGPKALVRVGAPATAKVAKAVPALTTKSAEPVAKPAKVAKTAKVEEAPVKEAKAPKGTKAATTTVEPADEKPKAPRAKKKTETPAE